MRLRPKSIAGIVFWILFVLSLVLNERYRWIDRVWSVTLWIFLLATTVYFIAHTLRHRSLAGVSGYPKWFLRFSYDDDDEQEPKDKKPTSVL